MTRVRATIWRRRSEPGSGRSSWSERGSSSSRGAACSEASTSRRSSSRNEVRIAGWRCYGPMRSFGMTDQGTLVREKLDQVPAILEEHDIDLWLTFVHETQVTPDPCIELIVGTHCTWQSAFLLSRSGERKAIVGRFDAPGVEQAGGYKDIVTYDESVRPVLREAIEALDPSSIALNYAPSDPAADGLTHGMWLVLRETLEGTPYADRLVSS